MPPPFRPSLRDFILFKTTANPALKRWAILGKSLRDHLWAMIRASGWQFFFARKHTPLNGCSTAASDLFYSATLFLPMCKPSEHVGTTQDVQPAGVESIIVHLQVRIQ